MIALALALAFFLGSLPFSWLLVRILRGVDLRTVGSGNPGATNAWRVVGPAWGTVALLLDIGKGFLAAGVLPHLGDLGMADWLPAATGLAAILGNVFCPFLRFKGGKAVATASGVFVGLAPLAFAATLAVFIPVVVWVRKISIGSLVGAVVLPAVLTYEYLAQVGDNPHVSVVILVWCAAALVLVRHSANIRRLIKGEETSFTKRVTEENEST